MHDNLTGTRMLANFSYSFKSVATFFIVFRFNLIVIKKKKGIYSILQKCTFILSANQCDWNFKAT